MAINIVALVRSDTCSERMPTYVTFLNGMYSYPQTVLVEEISCEVEFASLRDAVLDREYRRGLGTYFHNRL